MLAYSRTPAVVNALARKSGVKLDAIVHYAIVRSGSPIFPATTECMPALPGLDRGHSTGLVRTRFCMFMSEDKASVIQQAAVTGNAQFGHIG